jgi:hypothetical protein
VSYPFSVGSAAFVELGDGSAHDPQIKFTSDDGSCKWNGFPVCIDAEIFSPIVPSAVISSYQLLSFTTTPGPGGSSPTEAQWPFVRVFDFLDGYLSGYKLQARVRFTASGGTSVGSLGVGVATACGAKPGPIFGVYDSGFFDITSSPCRCAFNSAEELILKTLYTNFDPTGNTVTITDGILDIQWVANTAPLATYAPLQPFTIQWRPPCEVDAGLYIALSTDNCGALTKTYTNVKDAVNALSLGITASILGGHGGDIAKPDPSCPAPDYCCDMAGATCSGSIDN